MAETHYELLDAVRHYEIPPHAVELLREHPPLIIAAITAGGKNAVTERIIEKSDYRHVVTHTTRPKRPDEENGVNYWFVSEEEMLSMVIAKEFVEVKAIHGDTVYGISINSYESVSQNGHRPLLIIDVRGVKDIITANPKLQPMFILPPSYEEWMNRLQSRGHMSHIERSARLKSAKEELQTVLADPHFVLIVNRDIEATAEEILGGPRLVNQRPYREVAQHLIDNIKV